MFGKILGRGFYLHKDLGFPSDDGTPNTYTISELVETFPVWSGWCAQLPPGCKRQLFTMFETSDVHPDIIREMKNNFDTVYVPYDYLKNILTKHGVPCEALNMYTSPLIRHLPPVIQKKRDPNNLVFLYVGTNDIRKNVGTLVRAFRTFAEGTTHRLIVKTNHTTGLPEADENLVYVTDKISLDRLAGLYNICDYVISTTHGEGVGLPFLEAAYFKKPVVAHTGGVLETLSRSSTESSWIPLPCKEVPIPSEGVPDFLKKVFHGTWWDVDPSDVVKVLRQLTSSSSPPS